MVGSRSSAQVAANRVWLGAATVVRRTSMVLVVATVVAILAMPAPASPVALAQPTLPLTNGSPAVRVPAIALDSATYSGASGSTVNISGRLRRSGRPTAKHVPIGGAELTVSTLDLASTGTTPVTLPSIFTKGDGTFSLPFVVSGVTRVIINFSPNQLVGITASATAVVRATAQSIESQSANLPWTNGVPAVEIPKLMLHRVDASVADGTALNITGDLRTADGASIKGAVLSVSARDLATSGAVDRPYGSISTAGDGTFSVPWTANGATRLTVAFAPKNATLPTAVATAIVRSKLSLALRRSISRLRMGRTLVLSGSLGGAGKATRGVPVEIQALVDRRWRAVHVSTTNERGVYSWRYKFKRVRKDTSFSFRSVVRKSPGWPWPTIISGKQRVRVKV